MTRYVKRLNREYYPLHYFMLIVFYLAHYTNGSVLTALGIKFAQSQSVGDCTAGTHFSCVRAYYFWRFTLAYNKRTRSFIQSVSFSHV